VITALFRESRRHAIIATLALLMIALHLVLRYSFQLPKLLDKLAWHDMPLLIALTAGGVPLLVELLAKIWQRQFGADLIAGISIATSVLLGEYLAGSLVVLMLSGGEALEAFAVRSASSVLAALARRVPSRAHRKQDGFLQEIALAQVAIGDALVVLPHEICPVDGTVIDGHGVMDESYLTGEPYIMSKTPGSVVLSGAINGDSALTIRADRLAADSRCAKIMQVMRASEQQRPRMRRLGDQLGAWYTPIAVALAVIAWGLSGDATRFLAVLVVATPCPLLIAIPVAIIGAISLSARRGIIVKDPAVLETIDTCTIAIFDKTGTLTIGQPRLTDIVAQHGFGADDVLRLTASLEQYSKHPLAEAVRAEACVRRLHLRDASEIREPPGEGLIGKIDNRSIRVTNRKKLLATNREMEGVLPPTTGGLECVVLIDGTVAATLRFRDQPRCEGKPFIDHLKPKHHFSRVILMSGDRESEVRFLAEAVGITEVFAGQMPEQKWHAVQELTQAARTLFVGDGINDAPALAAATVGLAFGQNSDITSEAAGAVIMDCSLMKVDEFFHISRRMRQIALQSALGGMALSIVGMLLASFGLLPPVAGAIAQEVIDVLAVINALRVAVPPQTLSDFIEIRAGEAPAAP
jgi:heavy metal translocating P-type ATPase